MFNKYLMALALALPIMPAAQASDALAKKYNCLACHQASKRSVGPSFQDMAAKYRDESDASSTLAKRIKNGGVGVWGRIPMPPNPRIADADLDALATWILEMTE
jgi:cytochrome c